MRAVYSSLNLFPWRTVQEESSYWILRRSMARIIDCMAMKMFWYTSLMYVLFSSSGKPAPWMIFICLMNVDLPDSPVPVQNSFIANITFLRTWQICTLVSWASISGWRWQHNVAGSLANSGSGFSRLYSFWRWFYGQAEEIGYISFRVMLFCILLSYLRIVDTNVCLGCQRNLSGCSSPLQFGWKKSLEVRWKIATEKDFWKIWSL